MQFATESEHTAANKTTVSQWNQFADEIIHLPLRSQFTTEITVCRWDHMSEHIGIIRQQSEMLSI